MQNLIDQVSRQEQAAREANILHWDQASWIFEDDDQQNEMIECNDGLHDVDYDETFVTEDECNHYRSTEEKK